MKKACIAALAAACFVTPALGAEHTSKGQFKYEVTYPKGSGHESGDDPVEVSGGCDWSSNGGSTEIAIIGRYQPSFASPDGKIRGGKITASSRIAKEVMTSNVKSIRIDVGPDFVNVDDPNDVRQGSIYFPTNTRPTFKRERDGGTAIGATDTYVPITHSDMFGWPTLDHSLEFSRDPNHIITFNLPEDSEDGDVWEINLSFDALFRPLDAENPENGNLERGKTYSTTLLYTCFTEPNGV